MDGGLINILLIHHQDRKTVYCTKMVLTPYFSPEEHTTFRHFGTFFWHFVSEVTEPSVF